MQESGDISRSRAIAVSGDGIIASISSEAEQSFGYSAAEVVGRPITQLLADPSVFEIHRIMETARDWGSWEGEVTYLTRAGLALPARTALLSMSRKPNTRSDFLMVSVRSGGADTFSADLSAVLDLSSRVRSFAHEINNPLAVVMGFTQLILLSPQCSGRIRSDVERLYKELGRVIHVVDKMHKYAVTLGKEQPPLRPSALRAEFSEDARERPVACVSSNTGPVPPAASRWD